MNEILGTICDALGRRLSGIWHSSLIGAGNIWPFVRITYESITNLGGHSAKMAGG